MNVRATLISCLIALIIGLYIGYSVHSLFICPDVNKGIIGQLDDDADKVDEIKKEAEIRYVKVEKIKTVIKEVQGECFDTPIPDVAADGLLKSLKQARSTTN